jgi:crotonyl-CoA carboxylase/reductase
MKKIYEIDEMPELGVVPPQMYAWTIKPQNHGRPINAMTLEAIDTPQISDDEVLVLVMAAGMNYNGVWAALGKPVSPCSFHKESYHIAGSDASGIVWKIGDSLKKDRNFKLKVGDEVVVIPGQSCGRCSKCLSGQQLYCQKAKAWGYETSCGSFCQFTKVQSSQLLPKPRHLSWGDAASYLLSAATAWHMLFDFPPNIVKPGSNILIFGGAGGVGSYSIKLAKLCGATVVAITSSDDRGQYCMELGADGYVNRKNFDCWGRLPEIHSSEYLKYLVNVRKFRTAVQKFIGKDVNPDIVIDFIGEQTMPVSIYCVEWGGMVITCGATSGFNINFDASYLWIRQKRLQGSHYCSFSGMEQLQKIVEEQRIDCRASKIFEWKDLALAHELLYEGTATFGNCSILVQATSLL